NLLYTAFATGDTRTSDEELRWFKDRPEAALALREQANNAMALGQVAAASDFYRRARQDAERLGAGRQQRYAREFVESSAVLGYCNRTTGDQEPLAQALCGTRSALDNFVAEHPDPVGPTAYARGLSLLRQGRHADAAAIFDEMIRRRVPNWGPEYPAALVGRARVAVATGDRATARTTYEEFFALWKGADSDVPLLVAARREYSALKPEPTTPR
ncbi:MAG TPA: hypothetical protein VFS23_22210, partial [Vicinamibacterales bacterium]|nr:hypothetical protein [Vicinamibacterales bacterium]